jgi:leucyl-tRNA synthetase
MSKSRGNVINPDEVVREHGADTLRLYEMFMGPLESTKPWNARAIVGVRRFLDRAHELLCGGGPIDDAPAPEAERRLVHRTIRAVTEDIESVSQFNTAISRMMELLNAIGGAGGSGTRHRETLETFTRLLAPFAPHLAEEAWQQLGHGPTIAYAPWPAFDPEMCRETEIEVGVQVLGKIKARITLPADADEEAHERAALADEKVQAAIAGRAVKKVIVVKGRLVNVVVG